MIVSTISAEKSASSSSSSRMRYPHLKHRQEHKHKQHQHQHQSHQARYTLQQQHNMISSGLVGGSVGEAINTNAEHDSTRGGSYLDVNDGNLPPLPDEQPRSFAKRLTRKISSSLFNAMRRFQSIPGKLRFLFFKFQIK